MDLILVEPAALRAHWPNISASLEAIQAKAPEDWIREDVYLAIKTGRAACIAALDDGGYAGVMVLTERVAEFSGEKSLHVWIAHNRRDGDIFQAGLAQLRQMAAQSGAKKITFGSPRVGWAKRHKLISATYEIEA